MFSKFMVRATVLSVVAVSAFNTWVYQRQGRMPASQDKQIELHIKSMFVDDSAAEKRIQGRYFIKVTFGESYEFEFGKNDNLAIQRGAPASFDYKLDINDSWMSNGQLPFKVEIVSKETFNKTLVRCQQVAQNVMEYNRSYQCFLPMQKQSFLTYRLGDKNNKPEEPTKLVQVR